jgi:probable HAF family extracellular repeat protein
MKKSMRFEAPSTTPVGHFRPCSSNRKSGYGVETTKSRRSMWITLISFLAVLAMPFGVVGQVNPKQNSMAEHHHYKLVNLGTFGGPLNYANGDDLLVQYLGSAQDINNAGMITGWADTSTPDPYPNFCFNEDCYVSHAFQWQHGSIRDLGALPGGASSATSWISANGLIAGASQNGETDPLLPGFPENRAVLWVNGKIIDLGTLPEGGYESGAEAVNSRGQVVGWALNTVPDLFMDLNSSLYNFYEPYPYPYQTRAFLWQDGVMQDLGTLGTGADAFAMGINEQGQVIGISYTNSTPSEVVTECSTVGPVPTQDPFLWENGKMTDLGSLGGTCGYPNWLNNERQVVGSSNLAGDQSEHAFLWTKAKGMQDLGTLGGSYSDASMINEFGVVAGGSTLGDSQFDAFLWDGKMHDLGALDGCSFALAINNADQVVGNWGGPQCKEGAFLWENGGPMVDLNTLVSSASGLSVAAAFLINNLGEIVGSSADVTGNLYAMLLIPCDENHPGIEGCDYSLVDSATAAEVHRAEITKAPAAAVSQPKLSPAALMARFRSLQPGHNRRFGAPQTSPQ